MIISEYKNEYLHRFLINLPNSNTYAYFLKHSNQNNYDIGLLDQADFEYYNKEDEDVLWNLCNERSFCKVNSDIKKIIKYHELEQCSTLGNVNKYDIVNQLVALSYFFKEILKDDITEIFINKESIKSNNIFSQDNKSVQIESPYSGDKYIISLKENDEKFFIDFFIKNKEEIQKGQVRIIKGDNLLDLTPSQNNGLSLAEVWDSYLIHQKKVRSPCF